MRSKKDDRHVESITQVKIRTKCTGFIKCFTAFYQ